MANTILYKRSDTPDKIPNSGDLQSGELAININDGKIFTNVNNSTKNISSQPVGMIMPLSNGVPNNTDWLPCDGRKYLKSQYPALANKIGDAYDVQFVTNSVGIASRTIIVSNGSGLHVMADNNKPVSYYSNNGGYLWNSGNLPMSGISSIAYNSGSNNFLGISNNSNITARSTDGSGWIAGNFPPTNKFNAMCSGNLGACAVTDGQYSTTTVDGLLWYPGVLPFSGNWNAVGYNGSLYCALASGTNSGAISANGLNWSGVTLPVTGNWQAITGTGTNGFYAITYDSTVAANSVDGTNWTQQTLPFSGNWRDVEYGGNALVAVCANSASGGLSYDGVTWHRTTFPRSESWWKLAWNGSIFVAIASSRDTNAIAASSPDGSGWTYRNPNPATSSRCWGIAWNGSVFCVVSEFGRGSNYCTTSTDGINWNYASLAFSPGQTYVGVYNPQNGSYRADFCKDLVWTGQKFIIINYTSSSAVLSSDQNGTTPWIIASNGASNTVNDIESDGNKYCAISASGAYSWLSNDGVSWSGYMMPTGVTWTGLKWNGSQFLAVSNGLYSATSPDGTGWTLRTSPTATSRKPAWNGSQYLLTSASSNQNVVYTSSDGINWNRIALPRTAVFPLDNPVWNGYTYCLAGPSSAFVLFSRDGINWTQIDTNPFATQSNNLSAINEKFIHNSTASTSYKLITPDTGNFITPPLTTNVGGFASGYTANWYIKT